MACNLLLTCPARNRRIACFREHFRRRNAISPPKPETPWTLAECADRMSLAGYAEAIRLAAGVKWLCLAKKKFPLTPAYSNSHQGKQAGHAEHAYARDGQTVRFGAHGITAFGCAPSLVSSADPDMRFRSSISLAMQKASNPAGLAFAKSIRC